MSKWVKFKNLSKSDKIFRIINLVLMFLQFAACVGLGIYYLTIGDSDNRLMASFGIAVVTILPLLGELIFRRRLSNILFLFYQLYVVIAGLVGSVLNVYYYVSWYDILVHISAGYVFAVLGIFIISRLENYKKLSKWTVVLFCFCLTMTCELVWELLEWGADLFFNQTAQGIPPEGMTAPLVTDTMEDILCNFGGGLLFCLQFIIGKSCKYSLGIKFFEKELVLDKEEKTFQPEYIGESVAIDIDNSNEYAEIEEVKHKNDKEE